MSSFCDKWSEESSKWKEIFTEFVNEVDDTKHTSIKIGPCHTLMGHEYEWIELRYRVPEIAKWKSRDKLGFDPYHFFPDQIKGLEVGAAELEWDSYDGKRVAIHILCTDYKDQCVVFVFGKNIKLPKTPDEFKHMCSSESGCIDFSCKEWYNDRTCVVPIDKVDDLLRSYLHTE